MIGAEVRRLLPIAAAAAVLVAGGGAFLAVRAPSAEQVATRLLSARYVNDAAAVYDLASSSDRRWRTREQHLASHPPFPPDFQALIDELARFIEIDAFDSDMQADSGVITAHGSAPVPAIRTSPACCTARATLPGCRRAPAAPNCASAVAPIPCP